MQQILICPILNFQSVLPDIDAVIYVDTDTVFLAPVDYVWDHFYKMNSSQLAALAPEHEDANGWYNRFARHPYYGKYGNKQVCMTTQFKYSL